MKRMTFFHRFRALDRHMILSPFQVLFLQLSLGEHRTQELRTFHWPAAAAVLSREIKALGLPKGLDGLSTFPSLPVP